MLLMAGTVSILGCKKDQSNVTTDTDTTAAEDQSTAEVMYNDAYNVVDEAAKDNGMGKVNDANAIMAGCTVVTTDTMSGTTRKMTIDFGTGCTGNDGRTRAGKILVSMTGRYRAQGTVITITFDGYSVNGNKIEGTKTITNMGKNSNGNPYFEIKVTGGKITTSDNKVITWQSDRVREWTKGYSTLTPLDDEYSITGSASGTNRNGVNYSADITKALQVKIGCRWIESGTISVTPSGKATRVIDYGNGDCDDSATVTINNKTYNITLR